MSGLILGIGNALCSDDGVGVHAVRALRMQDIPADDLAEAGASMFAASDAMHGKPRVLVIDAMRAGGVPGTLYWMDLADAAPERQVTGAHAMSLRAAWELIPACRRPLDVTVLGVEPERVDYGLALSDTVARVLPVVIERALTWWRESADGLNEQAGRMRCA